MDGGRDAAFGVMARKGNNVSWLNGKTRICFAENKSLDIFFHRGEKVKEVKMGKEGRNSEGFLKKSLGFHLEQL